MRLIDADKFKEFLTKLYEEGAPYDGIIELLDKEPTAYAVDKVLEQLEVGLANECVYERDQKVYTEAIRCAIEIVKRGGIDGR